MLDWQFIFPQENRFHRNISSWKCQLLAEWNDTYILLSLETAWTPLYEAYQAIAAAYHVLFVMQSIEPGERIYYNTDEAHLFFPD